MRLRAAMVSRVGANRERNEDSVGIAGWGAWAPDTVPAALDLEIASPVVLVVADGLGGHPAGDVASRLVVQHLMTHASRAVDAGALAQLLGEANLAVHSYTKAHPETTRMGTTVAGVVVLPDAVIAFNVGDSPVFRMADGYVSELSVVDRPPRLPGQPRDAMTSILTQCLGGTDRMVELAPHHVPLEVQPGDTFLACTDGVSDVVDVPAFLRDQLDPHDLGATLDRLTAAVLDAGSPDNLTAVLAVVA